MLHTRETVHGYSQMCETREVAEALRQRAELVVLHFPAAARTRQHAAQRPQQWSYMQTTAAPCAVVVVLYPESITPTQVAVVGRNAKVGEPCSAVV